MADKHKPPRKLTIRGFELYCDLAKADADHDLIRCLAEAIAHLESRIGGTLFIESFKYYEE